VRSVTIASPAAAADGTETFWRLLLEPLLGATFIVKSTTSGFSSSGSGAATASASSSSHSPSSSSLFAVVTDDARLFLLPLRFFLLPLRDFGVLGAAAAASAPAAEAADPEAE